MKIVEFVSHIHMHTYTWTYNYTIVIDTRCDDDYDTLLLTVEALKAQLEEQTRLCREQVSLIISFVHSLRH